MARVFQLIWPGRTAVYGLVALLRGGLFAAAQTPNIPSYEGCELLPTRPSIPEMINERFHYPAWMMARFNPTNNQQIAALRCERDSSGVVRRHLYVLHLGTHRQKLLVRDVGCALSWSRTGWIALERAGHLWKVKANGDSLTRLTTGAMAGSLPVWSPSGRQLACLQPRDAARPEQGQGLVILDAAGQVVRVVPTGKTLVYSAPAWWPDGRKLVFVGPKPSSYAGYCLYEVDLATNAIRDIFTLDHGSQQYERYCLQWLANGKELVWRNASRGLFTINLATQRQQLQWPNGYPLLSLDVDAKGQRVLAVQADSQLQPASPNNHGVRVTFLQPVLMTAKLNGKDQVPIE